MDEWKLVWRRYQRFKREIRLNILIVSLIDPDHGCPNCEVPSNRSVMYRRWYYAGKRDTFQYPHSYFFVSAVTYADHMLGKALERLESYGKDVVENTIVVFHADHGYQLGE